jgi:hypothetical protein
MVSLPSLRRRDYPLLTLYKVRNDVKHTRTLVESHVTNARSDKIEDWLSSLEPSERHYSIQKERLDNTGKWVIEHEYFSKWLSGSSASSFLCCFGSPGAGKTFIM